MKVFVVAAFICSLASLAAAEDTTNKCPWVMGKYPFDESRVAGNWYIIAMTPLLSGTIRCAKVQYEISPTGSRVTLAAIDQDNKNAGIESVVTPAWDDAGNYTSNVLSVWRQVGTEKWSEVYDQAIVASDYDNYTVLLSCRQTFLPDKLHFDRHVIAAIFGRKPTLGAETIDILKSVLHGNNVDPNTLQLMDHSNC